MDILRQILLIVHLLGFAALFGGMFLQMRSPEKSINSAMRDGAGTVFLAGLLLVGVLEAGDADVNHMKIGIKLVISIAIVVTAFLGRKKVKAGEEVSTGIAHATGGLALVNILIATLWN